MTSILSFDPSGNFSEGKGTTGICYMEEGEPKALYEIRAKNYNIAEQYWLAHTQMINHFSPDQVVIEGYRLYNHKGMAASTQANSDLETPQLIGVLRLHCYKENIPLAVQYAAEVKSRWKESVMVAKGILVEKSNRLYFNGKQTSTHKRDALKHALHFHRYGGKKK